MVAINSLALLVAASSLLPTLFAAPLNVRHSETKRIAHRRRCKASKPPASTTATSDSSKQTDSGSDNGGSSDSPSSTTTSHGSKQTDSGSGDSGSSDPPATGSAAVRLIFPVSVSNAVNSWSTSDAIADSYKLDDDTLNVVGTDGSSHYYGDAPDGSSDTLIAKYDKGADSPGHSGDKSTGFGLYSKGPTDLTAGDDILFTYKAYFPEGFDFVKGGKMPGLYGGTDDDVAKTCSGGRHDSDCWSSRMMFREDGKGELYAYFPQTDGNAKALSSIDHSHQAGDYGFSVGTGLFHWKTGDWTTVTQRMTLNTPGEYDGKLKIYVDGDVIMDIDNLMFRSSSKGKVRGMQIQTFFGGHDTSWAPSSTQYSYFKDFSAAVLD